MIGTSYIDIPIATPWSTQSHPKHHCYVDTNSGPCRYIFCVICTSYIIVQHGAHNLIPNVDTNCPYNLGIRQVTAGVCCYSIGKNKRQDKSARLWPNQKSTGLSFNLGLPKITTLITLPIKISHHPNARLLVGWRHYFNSSHQIVLFRCSLSPKWPLMKCYDFRSHHWNKSWEWFRNHAMISGKFTKPMSWPFTGRFRNSSGALRPPSFVVNSWGKPRASANAWDPHGIPWHGLVTFQLFKSQLFKPNPMTSHGALGYYIYINLTRKQCFEWWYNWLFPMIYTAWRVLETSQRC